MSRLRLRSRDTRDARAVLAGTASAAAAEVESALEVSPDPTAGAFFDVDNTIVAGASIYHFARGLAARDFITTRDILDFAWQQVKFRPGGKESVEGMVSARQAALTFVAGKRVDEIVRLGEEIYDELMAERIWTGTQALAQLHLDAGQRVWLVTATPVELALIIARRLGRTSPGPPPRRPPRWPGLLPSGRTSPARRSSTSTTRSWPGRRSTTSRAGWPLATSSPTGTSSTSPGNR